MKIRYVSKKLGFQQRALGYYHSEVEPCWVSGMGDAWYLGDLCIWVGDYGRAGGKGFPRL